MHYHVQSQKARVCHQFHTQVFCVLWWAQPTERKSRAYTEAIRLIQEIEQDLFKPLFVMKKLAIYLLFCLLSSAALVSCGLGFDSQDANARSGAHPLDGLEAGVTFEEYEQAAFAFRDCLTNLGNPPNTFYLDPDSRIYQYTVYGGPDDDGGQYNQCYQHFYEYDSTWQLAVDAELTRLGLNKHLNRLRDCLEEWDLPWKEDEHKGILAVRLAENGIFNVSCKPFGE